VSLFHGNGKLLLSGEYYVLDGALALALPTKTGQLLKVTYAPSEHKVLHWKSYDNEGQLWFEAKFDIETFKCLENYVSQKSLVLQKILQMARKLASNFLVGSEYVLVETYLEFPRLWGLGTSSTLIHNIATWAGVNPFDLLFRTMGGSGYDVACAASDGPIIYEKSSNGPCHLEVCFNPPFKKNLYFVYLGKKQSSEEGIKHYQNIPREKQSLVKELSEITKKFLEVKTLREFELLIEKHETLISNSLNMPRCKDLYFADYWGEIKSLGAWGGDFILVTSEKDEEKTKNYFLEKGFTDFLTYEELIRERA
jgi:mevalonate kinase